MSNIDQLMKNLEEQKILSQVKTMSAEGVDVAEILTQLQEGMRLVGEEFEAGNYYLSELIMSATIFQQAMDLVKDKLSQAPESAKYGTIVMGTVENDIHDIGKNIAATMLGCRGFHVVDLGVDVPAEKFVAAVKTHKPKLLGLSCLLTTCFESMKTTIEAIKKAGLRDGLPIIIGGATIDQNTSTYVGADAFCLNANDAVTTAQKFAGGDA